MPVNQIAYEIGNDYLRSITPKVASIGYFEKLREIKSRLFVFNFYLQKQGEI